MNGDCFKNWFETLLLLPNIQKNSVIVMDNAPYHSVLLEKTPTDAWRKAEIYNWLTCHNIAASPDMLKQDLYDMVKQHRKNKK